MVKTKIKVIWTKNYLFNSFWAPKVLNGFVKKGNKASVENEFFYLFKELKKITTRPVFLLLGLVKRSRPAFGLKVILNKVSKLKTDDTSGKDIPKYLRVPIPIRKLRGLKLGINWFRVSCMLFWKKMPLNRRLYSEVYAMFVNKNSKVLGRKKALYVEGLRNRLSVKYRW